MIELEEPRAVGRGKCNCLVLTYLHFAHQFDTVT